MSETGVAGARELAVKGFFYDNLIDMAGCCREESDPEMLLAAYILEKIFLDLAAELGDGPVIASTLRRMEARYRAALDLALEKTAEGGHPKEQAQALQRIVRLLRDKENLT
ncbi:MAG: hypothetical protein JW821_01115 [Deltaproteobacteria bacterium]|nr:hypothetical protein [Deltaproteobacteria bacterium]